MNGLENERPVIDSFAEIVRQYCAWAEGPPLEPNEDILSAQVYLARLHLGVIGLPNLEPDDEDVSDKVTAEQQKSVCWRFSSLPIQGYWDVFDPLITEGGEAVFNSLSDDLADIYRDIKEGLVLYDAGKLKDAVWEWQFNFKIHWGQHLTGAQRAINSYLRDH